MNTDTALARARFSTPQWPIAKHGIAGTRVALFLHGNPDVVLYLAQHHPACGAGRALHRARPDRLRPIGQAGYRLPVLPTMSAISMPSSRRTASASAYLVAQDWGTALAFHLAARRPEFVRGLAFMEFIRPMPTWEDFHQVAAGARDVPQVQDTGRGRGDDPRGKRLRGARPAGLDQAQAERRRDGCLSRAVSDAAVAPAHLGVAERIADRRRTARRPCATRGGACGARGLALPQAAVRRRSGRPGLAGLRREVRRRPV